MYDIAVVGGGIIGAACAYTLSKYKLKIAVLKEERCVLRHNKGKQRHYPRGL